MFPERIFSYITQQESEYETQEIQVGDNWHWNMRRHVQMLFHLKNGVFYTGENDYTRAFKNIMEPILHLAHWTEDLEVKDVVFYIEGQRDRALSFLIKKYHDDVYVKEHNLDELFDEITESDTDFGGVLVECADGRRPKAVSLTKVAFCDQTDILGGPIGLKMYFSPSKLLAMGSHGWGKNENGATGSLKELITLADQSKDPEGGRREANENETPGKNIEVYIVRGSLPKHYLEDNEDMDTFQNQVQVVAFYYDSAGNRNGYTLYRKQEQDGKMKFHTSQKVPGRALGRGVGEAAIHPQIWTNFLEIHKMKMLEAGARVPLYTDDESYPDTNEIQEMENLEVTKVQQGRRIFQVPTAETANITLFQNAIDQWFEFSQYAGAAFDPLMGKEAPSGTTFRGQERTVQQGRGIHDRRRGKRAKFIEELYRDKIIPDIRKEIVSGKEFLAELSSDEMNWLAGQLENSFVMRKQAASLFDGEIPDSEDVLRAEFREDFFKGGNKKILKILRDEFRDVEIKIGINIANKQKDLGMMSDKLLSIFQFVFANPQAFQQALQIPAMEKAFNDILEFSGISQTDFYSFTGAGEAARQQTETQSLLQTTQGGQQQGQQQNTGQTTANV